MLGALLQLGWRPSKKAQQRSGGDSAPGRRRAIYGQALNTFGISRAPHQRATIGPIPRKTHASEALRLIPTDRLHHFIRLLGQLQQRYGEKVTITYQQREPGAIVIDFAKVG